jgi:hypothetical protein
VWPQVLFGTYVGCDYKDHTKKQHGAFFLAEVVGKFQPLLERHATCHSPARVIDLPPAEALGLLTVAGFYLRFLSCKYAPTRLSTTASSVATCCKPGNALRLAV